jgi:hypothetical protein
MLTLYTTPVLYLWMERLRVWCANQWQRLFRRPSLTALEHRP